MKKTIMHELGDYGQSLWLDYISRSLLDSGKLQGLIDQGLRGMTSNPSIFNQSIGSTNEYDDKIVKLKAARKSAFEIYDELTIKDIQDAADAFAGVYKTTKGLDGYVSLEINPLLAKKIEEQAQEGLRLYKKVSRPNVMIKVPSTPEGIGVVEQLIANEVNVNVTLIFSLKQYEETAKAYLRGLHTASKRKKDLSHIRSVASVFVSRVDTFIDKVLDEKIAQEKNDLLKAKLGSLKGKAAVSNCRIIFEKYLEQFSTKEFKSLSAFKANEQRVLWGSTSTKNPQYKDVKYVEELITRPTVNTVPEATLMAFIDHGTMDHSFDGIFEGSCQTIAALKNQGIDIDQVCAKLLEDGLKAFDQAFETLLSTIEKKSAQLSVSR